MNPACWADIFFPSSPAMDCRFIRAHRLTGEMDETWSGLTGWCAMAVKRLAMTPPPPLAPDGASHNLAGEIGEPESSGLARALAEKPSRAESTMVHTRFPKEISQTLSRGESTRAQASKKGEGDERHRVDNESVNGQLFLHDSASLG